MSCFTLLFLMNVSFQSTLSPLHTSSQIVYIMLMLSSIAGLLLLGFVIALIVRSMRKNIHQKNMSKNEKRDRVKVATSMIKSPSGNIFIARGTRSQSKGNKKYASLSGIINPTVRSATLTKKKSIAM